MAIEVVGALVLTSPTHQSALLGKNEKGPRRTMTMPVVDAGSEQMRTVPFITANSVRAKIRRLAAERVFRVFEDRKETMSRDTALVLTRGAVGRADINAHGGADAIVRAAKNVFAGLFGGGPGMVHGRLAVAPLLPLIQWTKALLPPLLQPKVLPESAYVQEREMPDGSTKTAVTLLAKMMWTARDPLLDGMGAGVITDYAHTIADWVAQMDAESAEHKAAAVKKKAPKKDVAASTDEEGGATDAPAEDEALGAKSALKNFGEMWVIPPGMPMQWHMTTSQSATEAQDGLALLALMDFCRRNSVGGNWARGMGRFNAQGLMLVADGDEPVPVFSGPDYSLNHAHPGIKRRVEAAEAAINALTSAEIDAAFGVASAKRGKAGESDEA